MDLTTITVADFKNQFPRGFPYLPVYSDTTVYNTDDVVYYSVNGLFYICLADSTVGQLPTDTDYFAKTSDSVDNYVQDSDIERAFNEARISFNQSLVSDATDDNVKLVYLYCTAHYLTHDIKASLQGLGAVGLQIVNSRSAGSISESYTIPDAYTKDPILSFYTTSAYGMKYLNLVMPMLRGNVGIAFGATTP